MKDTSDNSKKPTWVVHVRPIGHSREPWRTEQVEARSAIQAEAILRRQGYETVLPTARIVAGTPNPISPATRLRPLACVRCSYTLAGLTLDTATVDCPECSYPQPLVAWNPDVDGHHTKTHPVIAIFAGIGMITTVLIMLIIIAAIFGF